MRLPTIFPSHYPASAGSTSLFCVERIVVAASRNRASNLDFATHIAIALICKAMWFLVGCNALQRPHYPSHYPRLSMITQPRTRVKICGITRPEDALCAATLGADAIGLVFYPPSPRFVDLASAQRIVAAVPPFVAIVGLFMNATPATVQATLDAVHIDLLQFHGDETPEMCGRFAKPYLKAVPMGAGAEPLVYEQDFAEAAALLLDSHGAGHNAGSGQCFDWARIPQQRTKPLILAGGLHPGNVRQAIRAVRPYAVDVSSGVESSKGIKDPMLIQAFLRGVYDCESPA